MRTETINGVEYEIGTLPVLKQLHVARRLAPLLAHAAPGFLQLKASEESDKAIDPIMLLLTSAAVPAAESLASMKDDDFDYVVNECLTVCQKRQSKAWAPLMANGVLMFHDIDGGTVLSLVRAVCEASLGSFFPTGQPESQPESQ